MQYQIITRFLGAVVLALGLGLTSVSPGFSADSQAGRYVLKDTPDGFLRLDTRSGDVSLCSKAEGKWGCKSLDEDGGDVRDRIVELERENSRLKDKVAKLELDGGAGNASSRKKLEIPTEEEIDKAMTFVEKMMRRFKDVLNNLKDEEKGTQL